MTEANKSSSKDPPARDAEESEHAILPERDGLAVLSLLENPPSPNVRRNPRSQRCLYRDEGGLNGLAMSNLSTGGHEWGCLTL